MKKIFNVRIKLFPANIYLFIVNSRNRRRCEIHLKLTINTQKCFKEHHRLSEFIITLLPELNVHKTYMWRLERHAYVLSLLKLGHVSIGYSCYLSEKYCKATFSRVVAKIIAFIRASSLDCSLCYLALHQMHKISPWAQDLNWTYIRRSEDVFWTSYIRSIYALCPGW